MQYITYVLNIDFNYISVTIEKIKTNIMEKLLEALNKSPLGCITGTFRTNGPAQEVTMFLGNVTNEELSSTEYILTLEFQGSILERISFKNFDPQLIVFDQKKMKCTFLQIGPYNDIDLHIEYYYGDSSIETGTFVASLETLSDEKEIEIFGE